MAGVLKGARAQMKAPTAVLEMTEHELQRTIIEAARMFGWFCAHFRAAKTSKGWRTPVEADGAGFPDLCLVRERVIFAELKSAKGKLRQEQSEWLTKLRAAGQEVHVWRPQDVDKAIETLSGRRIVT